MKRKMPNLVIIAILTTITVLIWISYSIYDAYKDNPDTAIDPQVITNINPSIDSDVLAKLGEKVYFERGDTDPFEIKEVTQIAESTPTEITPSATVSAEVIEP